MGRSTGSSSRPLVGMNAATADDLEADADTEGSGSSDHENSPDGEESTGSTEKQPLSMKRRIALVGALLLCVFTIFAFAFCCPVINPSVRKLQVALAKENWYQLTGQKGWVVSRRC